MELNQNINLFLSILTLLVTSCSGYHVVRTGDSNLLAQKGVRKIYIAPFKNQSFHPGIEIAIYNEIQKVMAAGGQVVLTQSKEDADAVLNAEVTAASYVQSADTGANELFPRGIGSKDIRVATQYTASLTCVFRLTETQSHRDRVIREKLKLSESSTPIHLWSGSFSRSRPFPGNNQIGPFGTTSALINNSEFDRTLKELAENMMYDVHDSMLSMF